MFLSGTVTVVLRCCYYQQRDECCGVVDLVGNSRLTVKPRNTVALSGDRVTIHCSSDTGGERIQWTFVTQNPKCRARGDMCNVVIDRVQPRHAGGYDCHDGGRKAAQASLIVIGNVQYHRRNGCVLNDSTVFYVTITFNPLMPSLAIWVGYSHKASCARPG